MDIVHLPMISYLVDWKLVNGTYTLGFIGLTICLVACGACWYTIIRDRDL